MESYDVVIVGYGPTGCLLALKLGRRGRRVLVLERQEAGYPLPRAAHLDDEVCRMLQGAGIPPTAVPDIIEPYDDFCEWRAADGEPLLRLDCREPAAAAPPAPAGTGPAHRPGVRGHPRTPGRRPDAGCRGTA
jgi:2-polyprenyl-6-methoxyphenol hydroxylase-like FAD-dependent oxidoreductase